MSVVSFMYEEKSAEESSQNTVFFLEADVHDLSYRYRSSNCLRLQSRGCVCPKGFRDLLIIRLVFFEVSFFFLTL